LQEPHSHESAFDHHICMTQAQSQNYSLQSVHNIKLQNKADTKQSRLQYIVSGGFKEGRI
jgi:hypothetical protein